MLFLFNYMEQINGTMQQLLQNLCYLTIYTTNMCNIKQILQVIFLDL